MTLQLLLYPQFFWLVTDNTSYTVHVHAVCRGHYSSLFLYLQALQTYSYITHTYPDLAIVQYARIKHALLLYQAGKTTDAVLEMEGEEEDLRGNAEVHAALAAMLYSESPKQIDRAETQWEIAREFDQRFSNLEWVKQEKHWPPAMQTALGNFLNLK